MGGPSKVDDASTKTPAVWHEGRWEFPWKPEPVESSGEIGVFGFLWSLPSTPSSPDLDKILPVEKPTFSEPPGAVRGTWIGHATVLFELDGIRILTDPVFGNRCSPVPLFGPKRYRPPACQISELPEIDVVVISHTHYDHMEHSSIMALHKRFPNISWFVPMGCKSWMTSCGITNATECTWWDDVAIKGKNGFRAVFTPTQHWSQRGLMDKNHCLWGSWAIIGPQNRVWFGGDTGYFGRIFKEIGHHYGPFDLAAIPIGAYSPRSFMKKAHVNPEEAVMIHQDIKARKSLGIHWGTFVLTNEALTEPKERLASALEKAGLPKSSFVTINHGAFLEPDADKENVPPPVSTSTSTTEEL